MYTTEGRSSTSVLQVAATNRAMLLLSERDLLCGSRNRLLIATLLLPVWLVLWVMAMSLQGLVLSLVGLAILSPLMANELPEMSAACPTFGSLIAAGPVEPITLDPLQRSALTVGLRRSLCSELLVRMWLQLQKWQAMLADRRTLQIMAFP